MTDRYDEICREACESARALTECPLGPIVSREFDANYTRAAHCIRPLKLGLAGLEISLTVLTADGGRAKALWAFGKWHWVKIRSTSCARGDTA